MNDETLLNSPLNHSHLALGARMVPFAGYRMPVQYEGVVKEHTAVRQRAGLFDVSHMGELSLTGEQACAVIDELTTNDVKSIEVGQAQYTLALNAAGTVLDDLIVYRRAESSFLVVCNASNRAKMAPHFETHASGRCEFEDQSEATSLLALQGPAAMAVLGQVGGAEFRELGSFRLRDGELLGAQVLVARTGYTGEDGVEIFCGIADAEKIWTGLLEAGAGAGLAPIGLGARDTLRLEARLSLYGNEIDEETHPFEAGLSWVVKMEKGDFLGRDRLKEIKTAGFPNKLVGFEMIERGIARHGYPILDAEGQAVGRVTSGSPSPTLGKNIGLGYVPKNLSKIGSEFRVQIRKKTAGAVVVKTPFYKRPNP